MDSADKGGIAVMNIVLVEPEIPANTGNIARTCAVTGCPLHLVKPLGFSLEDKYLKRAGLDYWSFLEIYCYDSIDDLFSRFRNNRFFYVTTKGTRYYTDIRFQPDDFLVFGKETAGLPDKLLKANPGRCVRIPMVNKVRSLNLSNSVAIVVYEAWRQMEFNGGN